MKVLAHGSGPESTVAVGLEFIAVRALGQWESWGWEEILKGSWKGETSTFTWTTTGGRSVEARLDDVGRLPEIFHERVQASTVQSEAHELTRGHVQIVGRRRLDGSDDLTWYATAGGGASLDDPATAAFVVERTDMLKADWEQR